MRPRAADRRKGTRTKQGLEQGIDGNKKIKGRKRHIVVYTQGMLLNCFVSAANLADVKGAKAALAPVLENMVRIETVLADQSYKGSRFRNAIPSS